MAHGVPQECLNNQSLSLFCRRVPSEWSVNRSEWSVSIPAAIQPRSNRVAASWLDSINQSASLTPRCSLATTTYAFTLTSSVVATAGGLHYAPHHQVGTIIIFPFSTIQIVDVLEILSSGSLCGGRLQFDSIAKRVLVSWLFYSSSGVSYGMFNLLNCSTTHPVALKAVLSGCFTEQT